MEDYLALYNVGGTLDKDDIVASVTSGETAMAQIWPGWYTPTADGPADYITIPTKLTDDSEPLDAVALQGVWCIGIPDNAPHKELAVELLEYVMSPEVQLASIENDGVPCRYSCLTDPTVLETYPHLETVCGALETGVYRPAIGNDMHFFHFCVFHNPITMAFIKNLSFSDYSFSPSAYSNWIFLPLTGYPPIQFI